MFYSLLKNKMHSACLLSIVLRTIDSSYILLGGTQFLQDMVSSSCCTSNQIPHSSYRLVSQPNCHICISSAPCRWNLPALTSPTYSKNEIVKITLLRLTIAGRMFDRFKNILFLSYHRLSRLSPKNARRLQPCVLIRNKFSDLFFCSH